ncbi:hypothetical protein [Pseudomonas arsenicoxydans]|uniref:Uncharacterized protein n=1 Tax=Pseudomonas arsenicoxydans TaxID=702115 RepID=A0A4P6G208_9PSED|nr:hypothetical protein [Pseudomonas arsenicoxydans]QAY83362.1 hypothetical protein CUN61_04990 [Pseudomonas arsenicoxydans]
MGTTSLVAWIALAVSAFSFLFNVIGFYRSRAKDLFSLRQEVLTKAEKTRSSWARSIQNNKSLIHKAEVNNRLEPELQAMLINFLGSHQEFLEQCEADASAFAKDVYENGAKFTESKCREYLRMLDPNLEVFERTEGVAERKYIELMERAEAAGRISPV